MGLGLKDTGYITNRDTIGIVVIMHVTYPLGHNNKHAMFMLVTYPTDPTDRYFN